MKRFLCFLCMFLLACIMISCSEPASQNDPGTEDSTLQSNIPDDTVETPVKPENLTEEHVAQLFLQRASSEQKNYTVIDCVLATDFAYELIGVVQFVNEDGNPCNLAFVKEDGTFQSAGFDAELAEDSVLSYIGNGAVTLSLKNKESGDIELCTLEFSRSEDGVNFKASSAPVE